jgi:hypothetical protein
MEITLRLAQLRHVLLKCLYQARIVSDPVFMCYGYRFCFVLRFFYLNFGTVSNAVLQMTRKNSHYFLLANKYASWGRNKCMTWNLFNFIFFNDTDTRIPFVRHFVSTGLTHLKHSSFKTFIQLRTKEHYGNYTLTNQKTALDFLICFGIFNYF